MHAADRGSHHYPFAFSLPADFYDGHPLPPSPGSRGSSGINYTRDMERQLKVIPADVLPVQRLGRRILPPQPNMDPVDQIRRIPGSCE